jgi:hypothetical protein
MFNGLLGSRATKTLKSVRERVRLFRPTVWCIEGTERHTGCPLKIIYAGRKIHQRYFSHIAFGDGPHREALGRTWTWRVARFLRNHPDADMLITETSAAYFEKFAAREDFFIPLWVEGQIFHSRLDRHLRGSLRDDLRKVRKHGYSYEITRDPEKLRMFHHEMYEPYISMVHGDRAALMSLDALLSKAGHADLLLVRCAEDYVAGGVFLYEGGAVRTWSLGIRHGNHAHVRKGAIAALYYYKILYLKEQGYDSFNAGASRAFLRDGALQYKRKWGMTLTGPRPGGFWLRRLSQSPGVLAFLVNNPFIYARDNTLHGMAYSVDAAPTEETSRQLGKLHRGLGLHGFEVSTIKTRQGTHYDPAGTGH